MKRLRPFVVFAALTASLLAAGHAAGQAVAEVRFADTHYRFADFSFTGKSGGVFDVFYVGVPGSNELNVGGGYALKRGVKGALLTSFDKDGWKFLCFLGAFVRTAGSVDNYQVLDTADLTHTFATRWELGVQGGFFRAGGSWNTQIGPLLKLNDSRGAWAASYRFGSDPEFRVGRVLVF